VTLRSKLLLAKIPLAIAVVAVGVAATVTLHSLGSRPNLILEEHYESIRAAGRCLGALHDLQAEALGPATRRPGTPDATAEAISRMEAELPILDETPTEPGEADAVRRAHDAWRAYLTARRARPSSSEAALLDGYVAELRVRANALRSALRDVIAINRGALTAKSNRAKSYAQGSIAIVIGGTLLAIALGVVSTMVITARLLRPLRQLSRAARRIGAGDLSARADGTGGDEIAAVAAEFNAMADQLAAYRRSSQGELLQARRTAQLAIDSLPDPVLVLDATSAEIHRNAAAAALVPADGEGRGIEHLPPLLAQAIQRVRQHVLAGRGAYAPSSLDEAVRVAAPEGTRLFLPRATPLYGDDGNLVGVTIVLQDVTRIMRFDELKHDLVATVAHEFRTPLTSLRMATHLLARSVPGPLTPQQEELVQGQREDCERLQAVVDDLLDLARIEHGRLALQLGAHDAASLAEAAADALRAAASEAGVHLAVALPSRRTMVRADRERTLLVLTNLLANAVRHTPRPGSVEVRAKLGMDDVRFEVQDTGVGIAAEHQPRLFDRFYRVPGTKAGGVGLGLHIAREIVQAHGGQIGVTSAPGAGSTFWFTLPRATAA
jgi:two-component system, NtrC family, sensor histidine kinase KinB